MLVLLAAVVVVISREGRSRSLLAELSSTASLAVVVVWG